MSKGQGVQLNMWSSSSLAMLFTFTNKVHLAVLIPALLLTILAGAIKPAIAIFLGRIFDEMVGFSSGNATEDEVLQNVSMWCIALTGLGIATALVNGGFFSLWLIFGEMQVRSVRDKIFISMLGKEMEWYDLRADGIGSLLVRIQTQVRELQMATSQPLGFFVEDTAASLVALGIAFYYSWNLTLVILAFVPITFVTLAIITRKLHPAIKAQHKDLSEASKYSYTAITAIDTVKVSNGQDQEIWQYACAVKKAGKSYMVQASSTSLQMGFTRFMTTGMFVVGFWYGIVLVRQGLGPGNVLTTFYSCLMATQSAESLLLQRLVLSKGMSACKILRNTLLQIESGRLPKLRGTFKPKACHGDVEMSNITFAYPSNPSQCAIQNATFFFPAGETTFVIGRSGSGKSTLGNLLMKFYQPSSGHILVDGHSIQMLDLSWLRHEICFVQQESVLFNETLFRNIALGRQQYISATRGDVKKACQIAMLQQTVRGLPKGLDTVLGIGGNSLSGGQKQRVAIARARLRDAPILILDEATSALDQVSRSFVMDAIRSWRRSKTTIIITHDVSEILEKDYVYVLDKGRVVQEGYRHRLLEDYNGPFVSFVSTDGNSNKNSFFDKAMAVSPSPREFAVPAEPRNPASTSYRTNGFENELYQIDHGSRLDRVSQFHDFMDEDIMKERLNKRRFSRGIGIGSVYTNTLRSENARRPSNIPSFSRPFDAPVYKPILTVASQRDERRSYSFPHGVSKEGSVDLKVLGPRGEIAKKSRSQESGAWSSRSSYSPDCVDINRSITLHPTTTSRHGENEAWNSPEAHKKGASLFQILGTVWPNLLMRDRIILLLGFVSAFISSASTPAFSYVLARLLGTLAGETGATEIWALSILAIAVADGISTYYMHYFLEYCGQTWVDTLRVEALKRILAQPQAWFNKPKNSPGRLNQSLDRNAEEMRNLVGRFAGYVFLAGSMMTIAIVWAFIVCWKLTLVGLASGPCMYAFTRVFEAVSGNWEKRLNQMAEATENVFTETFSNIKTVRAMTLEDYFREKHTQATVKAYKVGMRRAAYTGLFFGMSDSTNSFVTALILYYGAVIATSGSWTVESILQAITLLLFSSGNANSIISFIPQISSSRATATHIIYLANMPKIASHESFGTTYLASPLPVRLNSLSFAYPSRPSFPILDKISTAFHAKTCTAIVGSSGSGKSTIASLLLGIYPPNEPLNSPNPSLTFGNSSTPIFACNMFALRNQIALVRQTPFLFPSTIAENIAYGLQAHSPLRSTHAIQAAARAAGIHDFVITLPRGYHTHIGEGGQGLSGGQAQQIAIARALLRQPKVLILDEPTSALDSKSAEIIRGTIARLVATGNDTATRSPGGVDAIGKAGRHRYAGKSNSDTAVILITHSVDMMHIADRIIVLEEGRIAQEGSFEELARQEGPFSKLLLGRR